MWVSGRWKVGSILKKGNIANKLEHPNKESGANNLGQGKYKSPGLYHQKKMSEVLIGNLCKNGIKLLVNHSFFCSSISIFGPSTKYCCFSRSSIFASSRNCSKKGFPYNLPFHCTYIISCWIFISFHN